MRFQSRVRVRAPPKFVFEWMTTPAPADTALTPGLSERTIKETWKLDATVLDAGEIAGIRYTSKAILRKYPPRAFRVEEDAGAFWHRTQFTVSDRPDGSQIALDCEVNFRGLRRLRGRSLAEKFRKGLELRLEAWTRAMEEEAKGLKAEEKPAAPEKKKAERPIEIPKQYGS